MFPDIKVGAVWTIPCTLLLTLPPMAFSIVRADSLPSVVGAPSRLEIFVAVVAGDLSIRPVPKHRFRIVPDPSQEGGWPGIDLTTGFDGRAATEMPPGRYRLTSVEPLRWESGLLTWDVPFEIASSLTTRLELSSDNASRTAAPTVAGVGDEAALFRRARPAVFLVEADTGHGSGFLVDPAGLVVTNYHVVGHARYVAVKIDSRHKYPASILALDKEHDVAVIRVNPKVVAGIAPLPLVRTDPQVDSIEVGQKVIAIGSPLTQEAVMTTGLVSKIQTDSIISDININPGNSGGPLLNLSGEVVGITTFALQAGSGPGISGIVRIRLAEAPIAEARSKTAETPAPAATLLPVPPETLFPAAALRDMLNSDAEVDPYQFEAGKIDVQVLTPPLLHSLSKQSALRAAEQQRKRRKGGEEGMLDPRDDFFEWRSEGGKLRRDCDRPRLPGDQNDRSIEGRSLLRRARRNCHSPALSFQDRLP